MRLALYARVSTRDKGQDTENQLIQLRNYCERAGHSITAEFIDHATAKHGERDEFKAMFTAASKREFDAVLVWALDRFTREGIVSTFQYVKRLADYGVKFISYSEPQFSTTSNGIGELMIALAAWIAEQERKRISDRTRAGLDRAREKGTRSGKPIGRPRLVFRRDQVADLRREGLSWRQIASRLHASPTAVRRAHDTEQGDSGACQNPEAIRR
jgi:DNA invertase Pin-like site-specific DNA recombinase